jgi:hypothetical protein
MHTAKGLVRLHTLIELYVELHARGFGLGRTRKLRQSRDLSIVDCLYSPRNTGQPRVLMFGDCGHTHASLSLANSLEFGPSGATRITTPQSRTAAYVIPTNEDLMIARHTWRLTETNPT